ncbi:MAG: aconitate hydratase, partial [Tepidanaerobacter sp.]|nr:aconitate hydratase [Tepidanaerobacter sp.]
LDFKIPDKFIIDKSIFIIPEKDPKKKVRKGPNIKPIPEFAEMEDVTRGKVILKLGNDVTTDLICPAGALYLPIRSNIPEMSKHSFKLVDETFYERAKAFGKSIIVAGHNYGQGSSREQAAIIPRYLGITVIMAKSFARLHLANLVNWGILPLIFTNDEDYNSVDRDDLLSVETMNLKAGEPVKVVNLSKGKTMYLSTPLFQEDLDAIKKGGFVNVLKDKFKNKGEN